MSDPVAPKPLTETEMEIVKRFGMDKPETGEGHRSVEWDRKQPTNDTGIYLFEHKHAWQEIGLEQFPDGSWHPVFRCWTCTDVICDAEIDSPGPLQPLSDWMDRIEAARDKVSS